RHAADAFAARVVLLGAGDNGDLQSIAAVPQEAQLDVKELGVAKWCLEHDALAGLGTDTLPGAAVLCAPLRAGSMPLGVLALVPHDRAMLTADQRALLDVFCRQVALCLERARLSGEAKQAALRAKTEEMRSSLLSAVSHDLRTPLAAITGAATAVRDEELSDETRADLVSSIIGEATRLERLVGNLLDMTRLESGGVLLKRDWIPLDEIVSSALTRLEERLEQRSILMEIHNDVPLVYVDPVLFEQLFVNLLENADKYTPAQAPIEIRARREGQLITIEVIDHGPGIPPAIEKKIFDKFFRGPHQGVSGAGLGLPICKGIVEAHGGTIVAENHTSGGAVFRIVLPTKDGAPSAEPLGTAALPGTAAPQGAEP
ncbi:MAG TPA: ATP-binding protein, partial [Polyangiaceae bacterium]|nr:ATP-binding protein [Polyangiaceae bacterium]